MTSYYSDFPGSFAASPQGVVVFYTLFPWLLWGSLAEVRALSHFGLTLQAESESGAFQLKVVKRLLDRPVVA